MRRHVMWRRGLAVGVSVLLGATASGAQTPAEAPVTAATAPELGGETLRTRTVTETDRLQLFFLWPPFGVLSTEEQLEIDSITRESLTAALDINEALWRRVAAVSAEAARLDAEQSDEIQKANVILATIIQAGVREGLAEIEEYRTAVPTAPIEYDRENWQPPTTGPGESSSPGSYWRWPARPLPAAAPAISKQSRKSPVMGKMFGK